MNGDEKSATIDYIHFRDLHCLIAGKRYLGLVLVFSWFLFRRQYFCRNHIRLRFAQICLFIHTSLTELRAWCLF